MLNLCFTALSDPMPLSHAHVESIMDVATPVQQNFASETPRSLDFNFSLENTPTFPLMQLPVPSSK